MAATPQVPVVNAGELYVNGLTLSPNNDEATTHLNVARGAARNSTNINDILLQNDVVARLDRSGLNGLDTGVVENNKLYAVYVIGSSVGALGNGQNSTLYPSGALLSKEFGRPYMPAGYDMYRRIGAIATDNTGAIVDFAQIGNDTRRTMLYAETFQILLFGNETTFTAIDINSAAAAPLMPLIATKVYLQAVYNSPNLTDSYYLQPGQAPSTSYYVSGDVVVANQVFSQQVECPCDENAIIAYEVDNNASSLTLLFRGYDDLL